MKKITAFLIISSVAIFINGVATAGLYKWVDEKGTTHFSNSPPTHGKISGRVEAVPRHQNGTPEVSYFEQKDSNGNSKLGRTESSKTRMVELYSTSWCPYCKMARNFFISKGIPFKEYDIDKDKSAASRKKQLDSQNGVPFAIINGQKVHGFSASAYENALRNSTP